MYDFTLLKRWVSSMFACRIAITIFKLKKPSCLAQNDFKKIIQGIKKWTGRWSFQQNPIQQPVLSCKNPQNACDSSRTCVTKRRNAVVYYQSTTAWIHHYFLPMLVSARRVSWRHAVFATRLISKYQLGCKLWISKLINLEVICKGNFLSNTCVTHCAWQNITSLQMKRSGSAVSSWRKHCKTFDRLTHTSDLLPNTSATSL